MESTFFFVNKICFLRYEVFFKDMQIVLFIILFIIIVLQMSNFDPKSLPTKDDPPPDHISQKVEGTSEGKGITKY